MKMQFSSFLVAFFVKIILSGLYYGSDDLFIENDKVCLYYGMDAVSHLLVDIFPVTVMLFVHHKNYRSQKEERMTDVEKDREQGDYSDDDNINPKVNTNNNTFGSGDDYQEVFDMMVEKNKQSSSQFLVL